MNETIKIYIELLKTYNAHTNIYSKKAYDTLEFHINDSITLANLIQNKPLTIVDCGSGSGLPAIPIAILNNNNTIYAVESKSRKTRFLNHVKQELKLTNITIITQNIFEWTPPKKIDIITAKAFSGLDKLDLIIKKLSLKNSILYIPISKKQQEQYQDNKTVSFINKNNYLYLTKKIT